MAVSSIVCVCVCACVCVCKRMLSFYHVGLLMTGVDAFFFGDAHHGTDNSGAVAEVVTCMFTFWCTSSGLSLWLTHICMWFGNVLDLKRHAVLVPKYHCSTNGATCEAHLQSIISSTRLQSARCMFRIPIFLKSTHPFTHDAHILTCT